MQTLKQYKNTAKGLPDFLNWDCIIAPNIVLNKDGSLLIGRYFKGSNLAHATEADWYGASEAANRALCKLGGGWAIWVDSVRLPVSRFTDPVRNHFPDVISELIETERRTTLTQEGACLESERVLLLHYTPPLKHRGKLVNLMYSEDTTARPSAASAILADFQRTVAEFDDQITAALQLRPMQDRRWTDEHGCKQLRSDLVNYLYFCVSGELIDIALPPHGCYLDGVIEKSVLPGDMPRIGTMFAAVVGISGYPFPSGSTPGILSALDVLPFPLRWSSRYIVLDQPEAEKQGQKIENKWKQKARGLKGYLITDTPDNPDAAEMAGEAAEAIRRTQSAMEGTGYYTANVVLMDEDPIVLEENVRIVRRAIRDAGYPSRFEGINAMDALVGTWPGHCVPNIRRSLVHTTNLADLLPLTAPWQGSEINPCPMYPPNSPPLMQAVTAGSTPIDINLHVGDLMHTLIFGPPGSGKSTLQAAITAQFLRYPGAMVWGFDKGRSLMPIYRATGRFYDIGKDQLSFCPLSILETESDVVEAEEWIADCFHLQTGHPTRPNHTEDIHEAVQVTRHGTGRSISHFIRQVQNQEVREAMAYYSLKGPVGYLFDAEVDGLKDNLVCGFEISELMSMGEKTLLPAFRYIARRFARALKGQPALLQISEAWTMFGHPVMRGKVFEWLKELRKLNCGVVMDTQSLSDANRSGIIDVLLENCPTQFYGANPAAMTDGTDDEPGPRQMYQKFGRTEAQIEMIRQAVPKRHYLYQSGSDAALIDLRLGEQALAFVGVDVNKSGTRIDRLFREHGDAWVHHWLQERVRT